MKTNKIFWVIIFLIAASCNQKKSEPATHEHKDTTATMKQAEHNEAALTLNDGKKWKIDEPTRINIGLIKQIFQKYATPNPNYTSLAGELQDNANKLISECKMTGKDHEMLHVWLEKFLSTLKELKSSEPTVQQTAFQQIGEQLKSFDEYFE